MEKAKKNTIVDIEGTYVYKVDNSKIKFVIQGNSEKIPLSVWLQVLISSTDSIQPELLEPIQNHLIGIAASVCIGTECYHAGACSTNLCNTKQNLLEITQIKIQKTTPTTDTITTGISTVQSRSNGLNCLANVGGKSCPGGKCVRAWTSAKGKYTLIEN